MSFFVCDIDELEKVQDSVLNSVVKFMLYAIRYVFILQQEVESWLLYQAKIIQYACMDLRHGNSVRIYFDA